MKKGLLLTNQEKCNLVKELLIEGKTFREIERIVHVSPNFITKVKRAEFGENTLEWENLKKNKLSERTQAINLFYKGKTSKEVLLELDISVDEVKGAQADYLRLLNLDNLSQIVQHNNNINFLKEFYNLFIIFQELGINTIEKVKEIKELVEGYPNLQYEILCLKNENYFLKNQKKDLEMGLVDIKNKISLATDINEELEDQIKNKKIILKNLEIIEKKKSSTVYNDNIKKIIEPIIKEESWYKTTVLPLMIISVFEVIRNDPMGKFMISDLYNNSPITMYKNISKDIDTEKMINYIFNSYLPIMMNINKYYKLLHENLFQIYSLYLFKVIKMSNNLENMENNQKEYKNYNDNNNDNNKLFFNLSDQLNNNNSYVYIE